MLLEVQGLESHYGRIRALDGVTLTVDDGELVALVGANGAGKTTLLRTLSGLHSASRGDVRFDGRAIVGLTASRRVRLGMAHVPEGRQVFGPMSVEDNLTMGAYTRARREMYAGLDQAFAMFPILDERRRQLAGTLSGGEQQMLAIARALMSRPRLLLLDEPSMGLAPVMVDQIMAVIARLRDDGTTVLLVEQNAHAALSIASRGYVIETGRIVLSDTGRNLLANDEVREAYLGF